MRRRSYFVCLLFVGFQQFQAILQIEDKCAERQRNPNPDENQMQGEIDFQEEIIEEADNNMYECKKQMKGVI
jgi:hypothetical protein